MRISVLRSEKDGWQILTLTRPTPLPADRRRGIWTECWRILIQCNFDLNFAEELRTEKFWRFVDESRFKLYLDETRLAFAVLDPKHLDYYTLSLVWLFSRAEQLMTKPRSATEQTIAAAK